MKKIYFWLLLSATVVLASCGKDDLEVTDNGDGTITVVGVSLDPEAVTLKEGEKVTLAVTVMPENATDKNVQWSSGDESIATVSETGEVTAVKEGNTTISVASVADPSQKATCEVTVSATVIAVTGITLNETTVSIKEGEKVTLTATIMPENATDKSVQWSSGDESIATVSETGEVTAIKEGNTTISVASVADPSQKATCEVTVIRVIRIGDYYMKDGSVLEGTTSPLTDQQKTDCIGVVFWVGDPTNVTNGDPALRNEHPGCTHGLVVSLENAYNGRNFVFRWQDPDWSDIAKWQETNLTGYESMATGTGDTDNFQKIMGYNNTKVIEQYNAYCDSQGAEMIKYKVEPVVTVISQFESKFPAPANSSGWYLPSPKELSTLFSGWYDGNIWKIQQAGLGSLVSNSELMDLRIETLRGNAEETKMTSSRYWSSSQNADYPGSAYNILSGELRSDGKKSFTFRVRPVLAF